MLKQFLEGFLVRLTKSFTSPSRNCFNMILVRKKTMWVLIQVNKVSFNFEVFSMMIPIIMTSYLATLVALMLGVSIQEKIMHYFPGHIFIFHF